jgi:hypothetical protein
VKGIKEGDDVRGPLVSERKETMTPGSSWSELAVGPARKAVGEVDRPAGLDWSGGGEKKRQRLAGSVGLFVRTLVGQARVLRQ